MRPRHLCSLTRCPVLLLTCSCFRSHHGRGEGQGQEPHERPADPQALPQHLRGRVRRQADQGGQGALWPGLVNWSFGQLFSTGAARRETNVLLLRCCRVPVRSPDRKGCSVMLKGAGVTDRANPSVFQSPLHCQIFRHPEEREDFCPLHRPRPQGAFMSRLILGPE